MKLLSFFESLQDPRIDLSTFETFMASMKKLPRDELIRFNEMMIAERERRRQGLTKLYHGTSPKAAQNIRDQGFQLTKGQRSGFMGAIDEVDNQGIFLTDAESLARYFGGNRSEFEGDHKLLEVYVDTSRVLDATGKVPRELHRLGAKLINDYEGTKFRSIPAQEWWWVLDQPEFVNAVKQMGYTGVKFQESKAVRNEGGEGNTYLIFDPSSIHQLSFTVEDFYEWLKAGGSVQESRVEQARARLQAKQEKDRQRVRASVKGKTQMDISQLRPTEYGQDEANVNAIDPNPKNDLPLIVTDEGDILDGHHRWRRYRNAGVTGPIQVLVVDGDVFLDVRRSWGPDFPVDAIYSGPTPTWESRLVEMPLRNFDLSGHDPEHHPKHVTNPKFHERLTNIFKGVPYPVDVHFVTGEQIPGNDEFGSTNKARSYQFNPKDELTIPPPQPDAITLYVAGQGFDPGWMNNPEAFEMPLTPWMVAHRLAHALEPKGQGNDWYRKELDAIEDWISPYYLRHFVTTKAGRTGKMVEDDAHNELFAQFMVKGTVVVPFTSEMGQEVTRRLNAIFSKVLQDAVGKGFYTR